MKVIQIELKGHGKCVVAVDSEKEENDPVDIVADMVRTMIEEESIDEFFTVTLLEMSEKEYDKLPEWQGW